MKKVILGLFLIISVIIKCDWKTYEAKNEWNEPTGTIFIFNYLNEKGFVALKKMFFKDERGVNSYDLYFYLDEYVGRTLDKDNNLQPYLVKIKIDDKIFEKYGVILRNDRGIDIPLPENAENMKILENMKKGKILKMIVYREDGSLILGTTSLNGFTKSFKKITPEIVNTPKEFKEG